MAVVVSHIQPSFDRLCAQALRQAPLADVIELRLDQVGHPGIDSLRAFVKEAPKPVVVTCAGAEAHGYFGGSLDERIQLLADAAEAGANFVDVDWTLSLDLGAFENKCHRIVSRHDVEGTPEDLPSFLEEVRDVLHEGDIIKLATAARNTSDGLRMMKFLRETGGGLIAFCSGEAGRFTRLLCPIFGSPFTYAAPAIIPGEDAPPATAPGQYRAGELRALQPPSGLNPETAILGVIGRPVSGSWSPRVHGMALKAARLDAVYVPLEPEDFDEFFALVQDENFRGFSVTAPFKGDAARVATVQDNATAECGAANTLVRDGAGWRCMNTDVGAVRETLEGAFQMHESRYGGTGGLGAAHVLVLGTGGAARAAGRAVLAAGGRVTLAGRDEGRRRVAAAELGCPEVDWAMAESVEYDALVHATPIGSLSCPDELPIPAEAIRPNTVVLDAVYRPLRTPLLVAAHARGCTAVPGGEWFVRQAREQFRLFTNSEPDDALMRAAFEHAVEEERAG